jgi:branched-chain amino acid transport system permease protein
MSFLYNLLTMIALYSILTQSLNLAMGYGGLISLCHAVFYGIGGYVTAILMLQLGLPFVLALACGILVSGILAYFLSFPAVKFRGDFFVLVTIAIQNIFYVIFHNWTGLTGGPYGLSGIPGIEILGQFFKSSVYFPVVAVVLAVAVNLMIYRLVMSPFGRTLRAIREDELAALSLGKDVRQFKRQAFMLSAALAAVAGGLLASYQTYIDAEVFNADESLFIFSALVIGGAGGYYGALLGALVMVLVPEALRFTGLPDATAADIRQILFGLFLILLMRFRPQGLAGGYAYD